MAQYDGCKMDQWQKWTSREASSFVEIPHATDDKYSRGVLGVIAGSDEYPGSAVLTCSAALSTGIGMVRYFGTRESQMLVLNSSPEVVTQSGQVQAWTIGSGVDPQKLDPSREVLLEEALSQGNPVLLDAGALEFVGRFHGPTLITPHFRELARLLSRVGSPVSVEEIQKDPRLWCGRAASELNVCVLLKGATTLVANSDHLLELPISSPWMATAGTGDVLAGIIGALIATQAAKVMLEPSALAKIAATGAFIHAEAAQRASCGGPIAASDITSEIPAVVRDLISD